MTADEIIAFVSSLPGVATVTASEANGAPEAAWGDSFFFYDPDDDAASRRMPFATIVTQDYDGWDTASDLNRPGVFRLNIAVGRTAFEKLTGYPPGEHETRPVRPDYTALDRLIPHPGLRRPGLGVHPQPRRGHRRTGPCPAHRRPRPGHPAARPPPRW